MSSLVANVPHIQVPYIATSLKGNKRVFSASFVYTDFISTQQLSQTSTKLYLLLELGPTSGTHAFFLGKILLTQPRSSDRYFFLAFFMAPSE